MGRHSARRQEQQVRDLRIRQALTDQVDNCRLGGRGPIQTRVRVPPNHGPADHNVSHPARGAVAAGRKTALSYHTQVKEGPALQNLISSRNGAAAAFAGVALKMLDSPLRLRGADLEGSTRKRRAG